MRFIVTGATGFIGKRLVKRILDYGHECIAIVRVNCSNKLDDISNSSRLSIIELEMSDYYKIGQLFPKADCLINLAWAGSRGNDRMNHVLQKMNSFQTMEAIESMKGTNCKCIVTAGSQAEYGNIAGEITELTSPIPNTEYGRSKLSLYQNAKLFCEKNNIRLLEPRYFSLYGPGDSEETMIISILRNMLRNNPCELTESIQNWDFLYIDDAIEALLKLIFGNHEGVYNFASGDCRELKQYIEEMRNITGSHSDLIYGAIPYPKTGMVSIKPSILKLTNTLGPISLTSFNDGIRAVINSL